MTSIVRPARFDFRARHRQANHTGTQAVIEAAERAAEEQSEDTERLIREARARIEQDRDRERAQ